VDAFSSATDVLFADPNIARDALWHEGGVGSGTAVRVVTRRPDQVVGFGDSRAVLPTMLIDVRRSEVQNPASGDTVEIDGELFEVIATPTIDSMRLVWTCEAAPTA
jgi:hypothetical protein